jgi:hypothetical protein
MALSQAVMLRQESRETDFAGQNVSNWRQIANNLNRTFLLASDLRILRL